MSRGGPDGWLRCFTHRLAPSAVLRCVQEACTVPCFCSRFFKSGSWDFWSLHVFCPELAPTAHVPTQLFLVPHHFFVFYGSRRGVFRCKLCSTAPKGPRLQPVSKSKQNPKICSCLYQNLLYFLCLLPPHSWMDTKYRKFQPQRNILRKL